METKAPPEILPYTIGLALVLFIAYILAAERTAKAADTLAKVWANDAGDQWQGGKRRLVLALLGLVVFGQQVHPWPWVIATPGWFFCQLLLLTGEWMIGNGFVWVNQARAKMRKRLIEDAAARGGAGLERPPVADDAP